MARSVSKAIDNFVQSYSVNDILYTWNFSRYVNFMDFAVSRAAVKIYSVKFLPPRIIYEYVACEFVV